MASTPSRICPSSLLPYAKHDEAVLRLLAMPVTDQIIQYIARKLISAVGAPGHQHLPTPPVTPVRGKFALDSAPCAPEWEFPPLEKFLADLVLYSNVHTPSVLASMIYLKRILKDLQSSKIKHGPETPYRLAVALFIVASKYSHDVAPSTVHWAMFTAAALGIPSLAESSSLRSCSTRPEALRLSRKGKPGTRPTIPGETSPTGSTPLGYMFGPEATAALERDVLFLLGYNMHYDEEELRNCLNDLSSHQRAEGPIEELRMGQGRPPCSLRRQGDTLVKARPMRRATVALKSGSPGGPRQAPSTPHPIKPAGRSILLSPPCTPDAGPFGPEYATMRNTCIMNGLEKPRSRTKPSLEVDVKPEIASPPMSRLPNPWSCAQYPQLNPNMDVNYLSKLVNGSKLKNPFAPIGVPSAPPSTPVAGIDSLPFIYGGKVPAPAPPPVPTIEGLIVAPGKDSPWAYGQVGEILRKTMARQARQLAALAANPPRGIAVLNTPPPLPVFGSGFLYKEDPDQSTVEPAKMAKLVVSDVRWYYSLKRPIPPEMFDGELADEVKTELIKLGFPMPEDQYDGMPTDTADRREHPAILSPAPPPPGFIPSVIKLAMDKQPKCYQASVESGPAGRLNTRWDYKLRSKLAAKGQVDCEEQFKTTAPLRPVDKHQVHRRKEMIPRRDKSMEAAPSRAEDKIARRNAHHDKDEVPHHAETGSPRKGEELDQVYASRRGRTRTRVVELHEWELGVCFIPAPGMPAASDQSRRAGWFGRLMGRDKSPVKGKVSDYAENGLKARDDLDVGRRNGLDLRRPVTRS